MGILRQIRSLFFIDEPQVRGEVVPATEKRSFEGDLAADGWKGFGDFGSMSSAGVFVNRRAALSVPAIWAAVDTIAKTLASLPFGLYQETETGAKKAMGHPVYHIIRINPAPDFNLYSAYSFRYALFAQACFGDAFVKIYRNGIGRPTNLELIDADNVTVWQKADGTPYYTVTRSVGGVARYETLFHYECIHIKGLTLDGLVGEDLTRIHRDSIGTSIAAEQFGNHYFANNASPSGALVFPQALNEQQRSMAERKIQAKHGGVKKNGQIMVLDGGVKFEKMNVDPGGAMLNETRSFQVNQASRIFGVPVPLLAQLENATLNNIETMGIQFVNLCLRPWAVQVEQEFAIKLLTRSELYSESYFFRFNFAAMLRADTKARADYYKMALGGPSTGIGWMSVNEVRELENLDKVEDGDDVFTAEKVMQAQSKAQGADTQSPDTSDTNETNDDNGTPQASRAAN